MIDRLGVVLAGGQSSRFGADKFVHVIDGMEMGLRAIRSLQPVVDRVIVAGRLEVPSSWGTETLFGHREGSGPLGAIVDSSELFDSQQIVVAPCDMPNLSTSSIAKLIEASTSSDTAVAIANSSSLQEPQWLAACWRTSDVRGVVSSLYAEGVRSVREVAYRVEHILVELPLGDLVNLNESASS